MARRRRRGLAFALLCAAAAPRLAGADPIVIAHRGASAERPEHTLAAYQLAIEQGADFVEPDLVSTKDRVLIARHENELSSTTDVATHPEFAARRTSKTIDGATVSGWFSEDFTLAEIKTLRARERVPELRGTRFDGQLPIPTLQEILALVRERRVGVYPETKHPSYFASIGLSLEEPLVKALEASGLRGRDARVFIQSFEVANLKALRGMTDVPLVQLLGEAARPDLAEIARYARGIGVHKSLVSADLIREAHRRGLLVHAWTFRAENAFLPEPFRIGSDPRQPGDLRGELLAVLELGVDGYFTDHVAIGRAARDQFVARRSSSERTNSISAEWNSAGRSR